MIPVGSRVTWSAPHPDDPPDEVGIVRKPTAADLRYFRAQGYPVNRSVLVEWNGVKWDSAWHAPSDLRLLPDEDQQ